MPDDFDIKAFTSPAGRVRSRAEIRAEIDLLTEYVATEAKALAAKYHAGKITAVEFEAAMRELLKSGHVISSSVGRGGWRRMVAKDWGRVGAKLKWQYGFLKRFSRQVPNLTIAAVENRARMYAAAINVSYYRSVMEVAREREGVVSTVLGTLPLMVKRELNAAESCAECIRYGEEYMPVDEMPPIGSLECGDFCKCELIFNDDPV